MKNKPRGGRIIATGEGHWSYTWDIVSNAGYVHIGNNPIKRTLKVNDHILLDLDKDDSVVGVEILLPAKKKK